jgi:serine phosphatase RsbU (regulator of sigma subunit)
LFSMKKIVSLVFIIFIVSAVAAQKGAPLLTNFIESRNVENQSWSICQDNDRVMLFANRKGISIFDGDEWLTLRIPTIPYAMRKNPSTGIIYIGGDDNFGCLVKDPYGSYRYISLSGDSLKTGIITRIIFKDPVIWFYSEQSISRYNTETGKLDLKLDSKPDRLFTGMFVTPGNTFINVMDGGLFRLESDTLFPIVTGYLTEKIDVLFSLPYNNDMVLLGLGNSTLSLFDGIKYYDYQIKDDEYLKDNILSEGIILGDTAYAFSTLEGGAIVVDKKSGKVTFTINNQNELPDDEVFAIGSDVTGGLWLSHQYGLTRADLNLSVANYSIFPGLNGNLSSAMRYNGDLYVATSEGVFYLSEIKNYTHEEVLIKNRPVALRGTETVAAPKEEPENQSNRKNIFTRIFGKKITIEKTLPGVTATQSHKVPEQLPQMKPVAKYTRKTISKLKSINYVYKKIEGLNEKCRQLVATPNGILAATNKGLFIIADHKAVSIAADRHINFITWQPFDGDYFVAATDGYFSVTFRDGKWTESFTDPKFSGPVYSVFRMNSKTLWLGSDDVAYRATLNDVNNTIKYSAYYLKSDFPENYIVDLINDTVFLFTESGIHFFNSDNNSFDKYKPDKFNFSDNTDFSIPSSNEPLIRQHDSWILMDSESDINKQDLSLLKLFNNVVSVISEIKELWVVDGNNRLFGIDRMRTSHISTEINVLIKGLYNNRGTKFNLENVTFERGDNVINFHIVAPGYLKQNTTQYQYYISQIMTDWSPWSVKTHYDKSIARPGDYTLQVRARDLWGNIGQPQSVRFTIKAPFIKTPVFYVLSGVAFLVLIILVIRFRERQLHSKNRLLEDKVKERTAEIEAQKEEITASIEYASRIQMAMLPMENHFRESFTDYFIIFKPRDIVSGDFYWVGEDSNSIFFTVADCTGHGVPGAFMSTMGISTLNEIIANNHNLQANTVLNLLRQKTMNSLHQTGKEGEAADGMDIAFCVLNKSRKTLQYAGAYNPLFIFQGGELKEYKADRMPIGIYYGDEASFTNFVIRVSRGDTLYLFSDGFTDQFGGPDFTKYKKFNLKKLLSEIYYRPMIEQRNILEAELAFWKGNCDQVDDITILGIRI